MEERITENYELDACGILAEAAGRICYNSFHLPNPQTRENKDYLANIRTQMHYTVLEHASFTFYLGNVSRALLGELTRHRHHSFSVRSQRYCDESVSNYVIPPRLKELAENGNKSAQRVINQMHDLHEMARDVYGMVQRVMTDAGEKRKVANDAARYALPEGTVTELYVTSNGNGWLQFLAKRDNSHAAEEIQQLAKEMNRQLREASPGIFE
ncbi:MAG TPA: FAD-dependent thymidylate synthase [Terriglobia bacterium]|nr:FAD-dependent thymidylate synthase [Terriglobia bacterium]